MNEVRGRPVILAHVLVQAAGQLALLRRAGDVVASGRWAPPGGHVETGETPREAASRELAEEVGLVVPPAQLQPLLVMPFRERSGGVNFLFSAELAAPERIRPEVPQADAAGWYPLTELPPGSVPWLAHALRNQQGWYLES